MILMLRILLIPWKLREIISFRMSSIRAGTLTVPESDMVPTAGQYFVRVRATNSSGKTQDAFDYYVTDNGKHYGMKCFFT